MKLRYAEHRAHFDQLIQAVLDAADPYQIVSQALQLDAHGLYVRGQQIEWTPPGRLILLAVGKAASPMAHAANDLIAADPYHTIVVRPELDRSPLPVSFNSFQAGHPLPNRASLAAGKAVQNVLQDLRAEDLVILLLSGGGSALLEVLKTGITFEDLYAVNLDLLRSGASIHEINEVRKALSLIKAGGLARMAAPANVLSLVLSDVVDDDLSVIASGPTVFQDVDTSCAVEILEKYEIWDRYPGRFQDALQSSSDDTAQSISPLNILLANNHTVQSAASMTAHDLGFVVNLLDEPLTGEARAAGPSFAKRLGNLAASYPDKNICLIQGGETTVTVRGNGRGGRNQEFAVSAAQVIGEQSQMAVLSFATDGVDGPTDAAGAIVDADFVERAKAIDLDLQTALNENNTYPLLDSLGALVRTGPTLTNLNDIAVGFRYSHG